MCRNIVEPLDQGSVEFRNDALFPRGIRGLHGSPSFRGRILSTNPLLSNEPDGQKIGAYKSAVGERMDLTKTQEAVEECNFAWYPWRLPKSHIDIRVRPILVIKF